MTQFLSSEDDQHKHYFITPLIGNSEVAPIGRLSVGHIRKAIPARTLASIREDYPEGGHVGFDWPNLGQGE